MPEGDTIFRAARTLHRALAGATVTRFETQYAHVARVHDDAPIIGRRIEKIEARGKHLLMFFTGISNRESGVRTREPVAGDLLLPAGDDAPGDAAQESEPDQRAGRVSTRLRDLEGPMVLRTHMLMSGSWHIYRAGETWQRSPASARLVVGTAAFVGVGFNVPIAEFVPASALDKDEALARLGPDVLSPAFAADEAMARLAGSVRPTVAEALLQQQAVAGIGNVYKSELLFLARLWPFQPPALVTPAQWTRLLHDARVLLEANVLDPADTGVVTWRGMRRTTGRANPAQRLYVYGRHGQPCRRCGTPIRMRHHGEHNRSTYWCPQCQPEPTGA